jgi:hypothetical protein
MKDYLMNYVVCKIQALQLSSLIFYYFRLYGKCILRVSQFLLCGLDYCDFAVRYLCDISEIAPLQEITMNFLHAIDSARFGLTFRLDGH